MADVTVSSPIPDQLSRDMLLTLYRNMLTQRAVDTRGFQLNRQGKIAIAMGSEGHEAVQAGTGLAFERGKDLLYPYYRNTGLILACGFALEDLVNEQQTHTHPRSPKVLLTMPHRDRTAGFFIARKAGMSRPNTSRNKSQRVRNASELSFR